MWPGAGCIACLKEGCLEAWIGGFKLAEKQAESRTKGWRWGSEKGNAGRGDLASRWKGEQGGAAGPSDWADTH